MRKITIYSAQITLALILGISSGLQAFAVQPPKTRVSCDGDLKSTGPLASTTEQQAAAKLKSIWPEASPEIISRAARQFARGLNEGRKKRSNELLNQDRVADSNWALKAVEYAFYVSQLGVDEETGTFDTARELLPYMKSLGVNVVYAFPFLRSPRKDAGFDVSDFLNVDERYGGTEAFLRFVKAAKQLGMKIKMDLILNHISDEHAWFQAFLNGDLRFKDYFHVLDHAPEIVSKVSDQRGRVITYRENGKLIERRVIFPDISDTHYREVEVPVGGVKKKFWVYYTFYPFQIDLNFENPKIYPEIYNIINFWSNNGIDIFRLDAVPFLNKTVESHAQTHEIVQLLNLYTRQISPGTLLMPEACQPAKVIADYFGSTTSVRHDFLGTNVATTTESQIVYDFEGMQNWWATLVSGDKKYAVASDKNTPKAPTNAMYALFLRIHDELTQEMTSPAARAEVIKLAEQGRGVAFREGLGVAGRLADFLGRDPQRILMAYTLMMGKKGMPIIYFGDEIMAGNNMKYADEEAVRRAEFFRKNGIKAKTGFDARDINRGPISTQRFQQLTSKSPEESVWKGLQNLIQKRMADPALVNGEEIPVETDNKHIYAWERVTAGGDKTLVVLNLSDKAQTVRFKRKPGLMRDLISGRTVPADPQGEWLTMTLPKYAHHWLKPVLN